MSDFKHKATSRIELNSDLLQVALGAFFLLITLRAELLNSIPLLVQLVAAIPLLLTSTLAYSKVSDSKVAYKWDRLAWITFIIAYAFLINTVGILIGLWINVTVSLAFFALSALLSIVHSLIEVGYNKQAFAKRLAKDSLFILVLVIFGVLVVFGVY
jgi:hypothetical protein